MIIAWGIFTISAFFSLIGLIGIFLGKEKAENVFFWYSILALLPAQYIWG